MSGTVGRRRAGCVAALLAAVLFLLPAVAAVHAQTVWFKYEGNPVMDVGPMGAWDGALVVPGRVIVENGLYRMWYTGFSGTRRWQMGYATSRDGIAWARHATNPLLEREPESWERGDAFHPYVLRTAAGFEMRYTGGGDTLSIGHAVSDDGVKWERSHALNPLLSPRADLLWQAREVARPSVLGPDSLGAYRMWFTGRAEGSTSYHVGLALSPDGRDWVSLEDPVLGPGPGGSWDELNVSFARVLRVSDRYEMWFGGQSSGRYESSRIGYATSPDGILWTKHVANPVMKTGHPGSWDDFSLLVGEILPGDNFYQMWYTGRDDYYEVGAGRIGYALSPRGGAVEIGPAFSPPGMPVHVQLAVADPSGLTFYAEIHAGEQTMDRLPLFDDGGHGDGLAGDGIFANSWSPPAADAYGVDLVLEYDQRRFRLDGAGDFTAIGPLRYERYALSGDVTPNPGDSLRILLGLRHAGTAGTPGTVAASLTSLDSCVQVGAENRVEFGAIMPAAVVSSLGAIPLYIDPDCRPGTAAALELSISSAGIPFWTDSFTLLVAAPWWRTRWANAAYGLLVVGMLVGTLRYTEMRRLRRRIEQLEREQALERERTRISQDMHDDIGSRLTEISILSELATKELGDPEQAEAQIRRIAETSRELVGSIGEIIWAIDAKHDASEDLVAYLRYYASRYLEPTGVELTTAIPESIPTFRLPGAMRRNLFLVTKEALHNVVKHAGACRVDLRISFPPHVIEIVVADDGAGFDTAQPGPFGQGLRGMKDRMCAVGGTAEIVSSPGEGTKVTVRCPRV